MNAAAEKIKTESNGRVQIGIFPNSILGGDAAMLSQLRSGAIDFLTFLDGGLATIVPVSAISTSALRSRTTMPSSPRWTARSARSCGARSRKPGCTSSTTSGQGFRQITTSNKPIVVPAI